MNAADEAGERGRLAWRCRRGMKELDLLLRGWLDANWDRAGNSERLVFTRFLELPDPVIAGYLLGRESPDDSEFEPLVRSLRAARSGQLED